MAGRNIPAIECKPVETKDKDGNVVMTAYDRDAINQPGAYRVGMGVKEPGAAPILALSVCCPCGCRAHASVWDAPVGTPPTMKTPINVDYPGHVKWAGQLLNGVWTEDTHVSTSTKAA